MRYTPFMHWPEMTPADIGEEEWQAGEETFHAYARALDETGVLVPDLDAALAWAEKCPAAQWGTIEIRPSATRFVGGTWVAAGASHG